MAEQFATIGEARARAKARRRGRLLGTGDPAIGEFQDAVVLAKFGDVDLNTLSQ
jgi:hypothetical protein